MAHPRETPSLRPHESTRHSVGIALSVPSFLNILCFDSGPEISIISFACHGRMPFSNPRCSANLSNTPPTTVCSSLYMQHNAIVWSHCHLSSPSVTATNAAPRPWANMLTTPVPAPSSSTAFPRKSSCVDCTLLPPLSWQASSRCAQSRREPSHSLCPLISSLSVK